MFAKVWGSNHSYNLSQLSSFLTELPTSRMEHALISRHRASGRTIDSVHIFDVRVFNSLAHTYRCLPLATCYRRHEQEKRRAYDRRIREVDHGCFSPLVFSASGGMGPTAKVVYKKLAPMIASKHNQPYSQTINWLRCRLSFSLLQSCIMCLRGSRSSVNHPSHPQIPEAAIDLRRQSDYFLIFMFHPFSLSVSIFCSLGLFLNCLSYSFYCIACTIRHYYLF